MKINIKIIAISAILIALALALSIAERIFPLGALIPVPGIKLGLANVITMLALFYLGPARALLILISRCLLGALFTGITGLFFSLSGGILAFFAMLIIKSAYGKAFSIFGVSIGGAAAHNIGQIIAASFFLGENLIYTYLPLLLLTGLATGVLTAAVSGSLFKKLENIGFISRNFPHSKPYFKGAR